MSEAAQIAAPALPIETVAAGDVDMIAPRVAIEAFCVTPDFATAMQTAAHDRRMAKTLANVEMGGVGGAMKRYQQFGTPNLVVLETTLSGFAVLNELEPFSELCDADTRVIVAGPSNDVTLYRELMRRGVSEYLVTPASPMQIIEAVATIFSDPETSPAARVLTVYGVRGGVGASTLAHNMASLIGQQSRKETILVDLDTEFGTAALNFNIDTKYSLADALSDIDDLDDVKLARLLYTQSETLKLLASPAAISSKAPPSEDAVLGLIDVARQASDHLVLDAPHGWTATARCALRQAETVVLVGGPDLTSLRNMKSVRDWLLAERRNDRAPKIVLNQVGQPKRPEIAVKEFSDILECEVDLILPHEPAVFGAAQNDGVMLSAATGAKKVLEPLEAFVGDHLGRRPARAAAAKGGSAIAALIGAIKRGR